MLGKINTSNLWDQTYKMLKTMIINREFKPNEKLSIPKLSETMGISRTPIRDALNRLESEGLVRTVSKVGTYVTGFGLQDFMDFVDARLMIDFWVVGKLSAIPKLRIDQAVSSMESILKKATQEITESNFNLSRQSEHDLHFHLEFVKLGDNLKTVEVYEQLMNFRMLTYASKSVTAAKYQLSIAQHREIVHALKEGNEEDIRSAVQKHLNYATENFRKIVEEREDGVL